MRSRAPEMEVFLLQVSEQVKESLVVVVLKGQTWKKKIMMMIVCDDDDYGIRRRR